MNVAKVYPSIKARTVTVYADGQDQAQARAHIIHSLAEAGREVTGIELEWADTLGMEFRVTYDVLSPATQRALEARAQAGYASTQEPTCTLGDDIRADLTRRA